MSTPRPPAARGLPAGQPLPAPSRLRGRGASRQGPRQPTARLRGLLCGLGLALSVACQAPPADDGWRLLTLDDFINVNGTADTWRQEGDTIVCSGEPLGGARTRQRFTDFELEVEWKHHEHAGNSGLFLWCPEQAFVDLPPGELPRTGIEVQVLDLGYEEDWERERGEPSDWFTSHGDVFPVGEARMTARTPVIRYTSAEGTVHEVGRPDSSRSFPTRRLVRPAGQWNHYRVLARGGEVTLWVNGEEVNGGTDCAPASGYLALEAEGALVSFRGLRIRERDGAAGTTR